MTLSCKYSYNYGMFPNLLREDIIKLPVDDSGHPDWKYMENYIAGIDDKVANIVKSLLRFS